MTLRQFLFIATLLTAASIAGSGVRPHQTFPPADPVDPVTDEVVDLDRKSVV